MAAKTQGSYSITIKAIDATTTVVAKINKSLFNQTKYFRDIGKHAGTLGNEFQRFGKITGINFIARQVKTLGGYLASAAKSTMNFFEKLAGLSGLLTVGGIVAAIRSFSGYSKDLTNNARQIGITPKALQSWQQIGEYAAGISPEAMTNNLQGLSKTIEDSIYGRDPEANSFLTKMIGQLTDAKGDALDAGVVLDKLRHKFSQMEEGPGKAAAKMELISKLHLSPDMEPFLNLSDKEFEEARQKSAKYNTITQAGIVIAEKYRKGMVGVHFAVKELSNAVAESLAPAFTLLLESLEPLINSWSQWIRLHRDDIIKKTTEWVKDFVTWLKKIDLDHLFDVLDRFGKWIVTVSFKDMIQSIKDLWTSIDKVAQGFGGWEKIGFAAISVGIGLIIAKLSNPIALAAIASWAAFFLAYNAYHDVGHQEHIRDVDKAKSIADREGYVQTHPGWPTSGYKDKDGKFYTVDELARRYDNENGPQSPAKPSSEQEKANAADAFNFWYGKGLSPAEAAAMAAQEMAESGGDPNARGDKDANGVYQGHGAYQWHPARRAAILKGTGIDVSTADLEHQRDAAYWEYTHNLSQAAKRIKDAGPTPFQKGVAATGFESPDDPTGSKARERGMAAERIYNENYKSIKDIHGEPESLDAVMERLRKDPANATAHIEVSFNGFPPGLFNTQSSAKNVALNTSRTAGPIFA